MLCCGQILNCSQYGVSRYLATVGVVFFMLISSLCFVSFGTRLVMFLFVFFVRIVPLFFIEEFEPLYLNKKKKSKLL